MGPCDGLLHRVRCFLAIAWKDLPLLSCSTFMNTEAVLQVAEETKIARMLRELQSDMADLVASGDMTADEANEWVNHKADQWGQGLS